MHTWRIVYMCFLVFNPRVYYYMYLTVCLVLVPGLPTYIYIYIFIHVNLLFSKVKLCQIKVLGQRRYFVLHQIMCQVSLCWCVMCLSGRKPPIFMLFDKNEKFVIVHNACLIFVICWQSCFLGMLLCLCHLFQCESGNNAECFVYLLKIFMVINYVCLKNKKKLKSNQEKIL